MPAPRNPKRIVRLVPAEVNDPNMTQESLRGRLASAGLGCVYMPAMGDQSESPTITPGDRCPFCGEGVLTRSPSGLNLLCGRCQRITLLPQAHGPDDRPDAMRRGRIPGRRGKRL
jgi:hypothetical protein